MKKLLLILALVTGGLVINAQVQPLTITGQVVNQNGNPVPNHEVYIAYADSTGPVGPPVQVFTAITGTNGNYSATISLTWQTTGLYVVYTYGNCSSNNYYSQYVQSSVVNAVVNFQICMNGGQTNTCQANFSYMPEPNMICIGGGPGLSFTDNSLSSSPIVSWVWSFGNGAGSTDQNPVWCFMQPGIYQVCLTITTASGCSNQICQSVVAGDSIVVPPPPPPPPPACEANFYYGNSSGTTQSQFFDASLGNPVSWFWDFGDGTTSTQQNPVHIFPQSGFYYVCLTITAVSPNGNITCTDTFCNQIYYQGNNQNGCQAFFTVNDSILCFIGWGLNFQDMSYSTSPILSWLWDFGDGNTSVDQNPSNCFSNPGTYQVCLTIETDSCSDQYCQFFIFPDSIPNTNCEAYYNYFSDGQAGGVYFLDESSGGAYDWLWQFGDGTASTEQNPFHYYQTGGYYYVCLTIYTSAGCVDDYCQQIYYDPNSQGTCQAFFNYQTNPAGYIYWFMNQSFTIASMYYSFWTFGDGAYSNEQNPVHEYSTPGTYNVCLNIITPDSCNDTYCETITVGGGATTYSVSGNVYAGGALVSNAAVLLLGNTGSIYAETVYNGYYQFLNVPVGTYIIYAIPSYILYPNYIPTYYESSLFWLDAVEIQVNSDVTGADINLIGFNWSANGIGTITGYIIWNDTTSTNTYKDRPGNSVEDITILLMDLDDNVITFTSTDADGYFEFKTLPFGTYKVYTELTGHITYPAIITLDENNYTVTDIEIIVNGSTIIVGIDNIPGTNAGNVIVFPNPVNDLLNLKIQTDEASRLGLSVVNTLGQTIYSESISVNRGSQIHTINVDKLPKGLYFVRIENKNNQSYLVKFVK